MVVAQLVERSPLTPEICGSNPDIGKILFTNCTREKTERKKKRPGMAHLKKHYCSVFFCFPLWRPETDTLQLRGGGGGAADWKCPFSTKQHQYLNPWQERLEFSSGLPFKALNLKRNFCFQHGPVAGFRCLKKVENSCSRWSSEDIQSQKEMVIFKSWKFWRKFGNVCGGSNWRPKCAFPENYFQHRSIFKIQFQNNSN